MRVFINGLKVEGELEDIARLMRELGINPVGSPYPDDSIYPGFKRWVPPHDLTSPFNPYRWSPEVNTRFGLFC